MSKPTIVFECSVSKVQTLADGGLRVTLDLPEAATAAAKALMDWRSEYLNAVLTVVPKPDILAGLRLLAGATAAAEALMDFSASGVVLGSDDGR